MEYISRIQIICSTNAVRSFPKGLQLDQFDKFYYTDFSYFMTLLKPLDIDIPAEQEDLFEEEPDIDRIERTPLVDPILKLLYILSY